MWSHQFDPGPETKGGTQSESQYEKLGWHPKGRDSGPHVPGRAQRPLGRDPARRA